MIVSLLESKLSEQSVLEMETFKFLRDFYSDKLEVAGSGVGLA